jgi:hypothetical protein
MFIISIPANAHSQDTPEDIAGVSGSKWHPKMFYVVLPDLSLSFILPYEPDQSGVHNLFFISKESGEAGETLLLDTIKNNHRYYTRFSSGIYYDAVLLYNNGKYVRKNCILFENGVEVDMRDERIQPSDSLSEQWKTMRTFDYAIHDRGAERNDTAASEFIMKGYVFSGMGGDVWVDTWGNPWKASVESSEYVKGKWIVTGECTTTVDGYFEFDLKDNTEQTLDIKATLQYFNRNNIITGCGFIIVLKGFGRARKIPCR